MKSRTTILRVELLEDRCTPTTFGNPWPDASHLTLSFVPDGTQVGNHTSNLFQSLNAIAPTKTWEMQILRAFQTWASQTNINLSVVGDDGSPLGATGAIQNDSRFGDIRIAAFASGPGEEGVATPFEIDAGTWSGDVQLNSATSFSLTGKAGTYDLYSVVLHEAGHVFGLDHNPDSSSAMFENYVGARTGLGSSDVANIQNLYGARTPDQWEGTSGNGQLKTATRLNPIANGNGSLSITANADITTLQDKDVYSFNTLLNLGAVDVTVRTAGNSLLTPHATIYDSAGRVVTQALAMDPVQGGFVIHLTNVRPLSTYYIQIDSGRQDVFGIGSYQLTVNELGLVNNLLAGVTATVNYGLNAVTGVLLNNDLHSNDGFTTATALPPMQSGPSATYAASYRGSISDSSDVDFFKLQTPAGISGDVLTAMVWGLQGQLDARVRVFDAQHNLVAFQILVNDGFSYAIEISNATPQATYFVEVVAANPSGARKVGNYFVGLNFNPHGVLLQDYVSGKLTSSQPATVSTLTISKNQLFHFVLSADAGGSATSARVQMTITDSNGKVLFTLTAVTSEAVSGNVALNAGAYTVRFSVVAASGSPPPNLTFRLRGDTLTDPIGMEPTDPTEDPAPPPPMLPPPVTWSDSGSNSAPPQNTSSTTTSDVSGPDPSSDGSSPPPTSTSTDSTSSSSPPPSDPTTSSSPSDSSSSTMP